MGAGSGDDVVVPVGPGQVVARGEVALGELADSAAIDGFEGLVDGSVVGGGGEGIAWAAASDLELAGRDRPHPGFVDDGFDVDHAELFEGGGGDPDAAAGDDSGGGAVGVG